MSLNLKCGFFEIASCSEQRSRSVKNHFQDTKHFSCALGITHGRTIWICMEMSAAIFRLSGTAFRSTTNCVPTVHANPALSLDCYSTAKKTTTQSRASSKPMRLVRALTSDRCTIQIQHFASRKDVQICEHLTLTERCNCLNTVTWISFGEQKTEHHSYHAIILFLSS